MVPYGLLVRNKMGRVGTGADHESVQLIKIVDSGVAGISAGRYHSIYWTTDGDVYVFEVMMAGNWVCPSRTLSTHENGFSTIRISKTFL